MAIFENRIGDYKGGLKDEYEGVYVGVVDRVAFGLKLVNEDYTIVEVEEVSLDIGYDDIC